MTQSPTNFQDLSQQKISSLFWKYALPAVVGTIVSTLYNIIDGVFIGHWVGKEALSGLGVILPIMNLTAAMGMLVGIGSASRLSISLGLKNHTKAEQILGTSFILTLVLSGSTVLLLLIFLKPVLMFAGASDITYPYAHDFLLIFLPGSLFLTLSYNFSNMMRASGYPLKAMLTMLISVLANIILAPVFILFLGWGMKGAAIATTLSMATSFCFTAYHFLNKKSTIQLKKENIKLRKNIIKEIVSIGLAPFFMQIAASAIIILINFQLRRYTLGTAVSGDDAIAAFSNANRLILLIIMIVIGLTQGMQPIIGYNYGAKNYQRVKQTLLYTIKVATCITTLGFLLAFFTPETFVKAFSLDTEIITLSATALRYITLSLALVGFQIVVASFFQGIGMVKPAIFLSLSRQVLFLIPALLIVPMFLGFNGVWLANPIADFLSSIIAGYLLINQIKTFRQFENKKTPA